MNKSRVSGIIHIVGGALALAAMVILIVFASIYRTAWHIVSFSIFGTSLVLLYAMSSLYHMFREGTKVRRVFRYLDHMAIYILILGTYTPICLVPLRGAWGWSIFGVILTIAIVGIVWKGVAFNNAGKFSTIIYIAMGWISLIAFYPMFKTMPIGAIILLVLGGIFYSIGGIIYGTKKPNLPFKYFGHHEVFHIFVILGSACHVWMMLQYIMVI